MTPTIADLIELAKQGISLVALYMLYSITYHKLINIEIYLLDILVELKKR